MVHTLTRVAWLSTSHLLFKPKLRAGTLKMDLRQSSSTFLMLRAFPTALQVVVAPNHEIVSLLLRNFNFASVTNCFINILYAGYLMCDSKRGGGPQVENYLLS